MFDSGKTGKNAARPATVPVDYSTMPAAGMTKKTLSRNPTDVEDDIQARAQLAVYQREQDHPRASLNFGHDAVEMRFRSHHRPEMAHDLDIVELRNRRLGDIFECLARGVGYEM